MNARSWFALSLAAALAAPVPALAQSPGATEASLPRPIQRALPHTDMIRRAWEAGTRGPTGRPGPKYWQLWMDYTIHASLDPTTSTVTGRETAVIHNNSNSALTSIQLRLDQNIFAPDVPKLESVPSLTGGMKISRLAVNGQDVNLDPPPMRRRRRGAQPQAQLAVYGLDQTSARIVLTNPIPAHGVDTLQADWSFEVPLVPAGERGERMGRWADSLYQVGQWYPRVAVYDDLRGWDTDPYLGPSEFYNNFGHFDVTIDVPAGWIVGATGVLQNPDQVLTAAERERLSHALDADTTLNVVPAGVRGPGKSTAAGNSEGRVSWHFVADTVGDVAWATSNQFVWDVSRATIPGKGRVPINILYLPGDAQRYADAGPTARHALQFYSKLWMPYTFPQLTIVDGPEMGMEYPMFIMSSVGAADHETGHQWWPMMVGTNETWYGFMDEGFNQYMNILSRDDRMGRPVNLDGLGQSYGRISGNEREAPLMWDANYGGPMYSFQAYSKAPMMLSALGGVVGDSAVWRAMSGYAKAWRFKHPSPWDYAYFMDNALGRDLDWFWYYWLFTTDAVDGSIQKVVQSGSRTTVTVRQDGDMPSPVVLKVFFPATGPALRPMANATMVSDTSAIVRWPVDVWFAGNRTFDAVLDFGGRKIDKVMLDPGCRFPDNDITDNVWPREPGLAQQQGGGFFGFGSSRCYGSG